MAKQRRHFPFGLDGFGLPACVGTFPVRMDVLQMRHCTTLPRSRSSTSWYLRHWGFGHCTAKTIFVCGVR
jgi:hypothetical protein